MSAPACLSCNGWGYHPTLGSPTTGAAVMAVVMCRRCGGTGSMAPQPAQEPPHAPYGARRKGRRA